MDSVEGGVENNYVYPADPVNKEDLNGQWVTLIVRGGAAACSKFRSACSKTINVAKKTSSYTFGYKSPIFGNPTLKNPNGQFAKKSGILNQKWMPIRTGWSVNGAAKGGARPVFRTSIGYGKYKVHINWKHGRFNR